MMNIKTVKSNEKLDKTSIATTIKSSEQLWHVCYQPLFNKFDSINRVSGD